jgi:hypothetical protein
MEDYIRRFDQSLNQGFVEDRVDDELEVAVLLQVFYVVVSASGQIVYHADFTASGQKDFTKMRPYEAGTTCNKHVHDLSFTA